jgi:hypothetical protein
MLLALLSINGYSRLDEFSFDGGICMYNFGEKYGLEEESQE